MDHEKEAYIKKALEGARVRAETEWEQMNRPKRARKNAKAWVGLIDLPVLGSVSRYGPGSQRPKTLVVPAAVGIRFLVEPTVSKLGLDVIYLTAGSYFQFHNRYEREISDLLDVRVEMHPHEQYTRRVKLPTDRILVTWSVTEASTHRDAPTPPINAHLLQLNGGERELVAALGCGIICAHPTEDEAEAWISQRLISLRH